ncbi:hypothetical protein M3175_16645 [Robertmurraya korlensis]|uniref:hypothetical protein n=1 Tax=Robertmurraya korlensis TaxID=519977 RepID=UPI00203BC22B|nr:hypothetical protein [Robertmurraya korlensis]MCM3602363.1 hypothetical protein [Robertmurraya korlensis]
MSDNVNGNLEQNSTNNMDKNPKNIANQFLKNQNTIDLGSMMQLASTLLSNDVIMNSVTEQLSKNKTIASVQPSKVSEKQENVQLSTLYEKLVTISNDISELKEQFTGLANFSKNLNNELSELTKVLINIKENNLNHTSENL